MLGVSHILITKHSLSCRTWTNLMDQSGFSSLSNSSVWSAVSNAAETESTSTRTEMFPESEFSLMSWKTLVRTVSVLWCGRKPDWKTSYLRTYGQDVTDNLFNNFTGMAIAAFSMIWNCLQAGQKKGKYRPVSNLPGNSYWPLRQHFSVKASSEQFSEPLKTEQLFTIYSVSVTRLSS